MRVYLDNCCNTINNREPRDYTQWREANLFVDESVRETAERAKRDAARFRKLREAAMSDERAAYV